MNTINTTHNTQQSSNKPAIHFQVFSNIKSPSKNPMNPDKKLKLGKIENKKSSNNMDILNNWKEEENFRLLSRVFSADYLSWEDVARKVVTKTADECQKRWKKLIRDSENDLYKNIIKSDCTEEEISSCFPLLKIKELTREKKSLQVNNKEKPGNYSKFGSTNNIESNNNSTGQKRYTWTALEECLMFRTYIKRRNDWPNILPKLLGKSQNSIKQKFYSTIKNVKSYLINIYGKDSLKYLSQEKIINIIYTKAKLKLMREKNVFNNYEYDQLEEALDKIDSKYKISLWEKSLNSKMKQNETISLKMQLANSYYKNEEINNMKNISLTFPSCESLIDSDKISFPTHFSNLTLPKSSSYMSLSTNFTTHLKKKPLFFSFANKEDSNECLKHVLDDLPLNENQTMKTDFMSFYSEDNISLFDEDSKNDNSLPYKPHSFRLDQNLVDSYYPINISSTDDLLNYPNTPLNFEDCIINNQYLQN